MTRWRRSLEIAVAIAILVTGLFAAVEAASWVGKPFPGFLWADSLSINQLAMRPDWEGTRLHLHPDERFFKVDGHPIRRSQEFVSYLRQFKPGEIHHVEFADHGTVPIRISRFTLDDFSAIPLMPLLAGLGYLLVGVGVRFARPNQRDAALLFWFCAPAGLFNLTIFDNATDHTLRVAWVMALTLIPAGMLPMATLFREEPLTRLQRVGMWAFAIACAVLGVAYMQAADSFDRLVALWRFIQVVMLVGYGGGLLGLVRTRLRTNDVLVMRQVELVLLGWLLSTGPSMVWTVGNVLGAEPFPFQFGGAFFILFPAYIAFAVLRHRLFDVSLALRRTLTYSILLLLLGGGYALVFLGVKGFSGHQPFWMQLVLTGAIAVSFAPLRDAVRRQLNRYLFRTSYDFEAIVTRFGRLTRQSLDLQKVEQAFRAELQAALEPDRIQIELSDRKVSTQQLPQGGWVVPLTVGGDPLGCVVLSERTSGMPYGPPDQALVAALCQQFSFALRTSQLVSRLQEQLEQQERYIQRLMESDDVIARLQQMDSLRRDAFSQASHDLRAPLASISLTCQSLLKGHFGPVPDDVAQEVRVILGNTQALGALIDGILDQAKHEAHKLVLDLSPVALAPVAQEVVALVLPLAEAADNRIIVDASLERVPALLADGRRLRQVLLNLLSNAVKFTADGEVRLEAERMGREVRVRVRDTGAGMSAEQVSRLFEPFAQSRENKLGLSGSGLGLILVKAIAELHGARLAIESAERQGTTVDLFWPASGDEASDGGEQIVEIQGLG